MIELPEDFVSFNEKKKEGFLQIKKEKDKGKNLVGIFCSYTPVELIMAAGAHYVSLCGGDEKEIATAETRLPKNLCPLIKASYGAALSGSCPYFYFSDCILAETTCDGKKKMYELLGDIKPVHVMHLPQGQSGPLALESWKEAIFRTKEFLEGQFNIKITEDKLKEAIKERNRIRKALVNLYEVAKLVPSPVSGYELSTVVEATDFNFTGEDMVEYLDKKREEFIGRYKAQVPNKERRPRIMVTGCPIGGAREKILKAIEDAGADVVAFDSCSGPRTQKILVDETIEPYEAIAKKYLAINCSVMTPNNGRFDDIETMIEDYKVDGVVEFVLQTCHTFAIESFKTKNLITKKHKMPYLYIETDYSKSDTGQISTRLSAFLEMIKMNID